jgi:hypothetical protein
MFDDDFRHLAYLFHLPQLGTTDHVCRAWSDRCGPNACETLAHKNLAAEPNPGPRLQRHDRYPAGDGEGEVDIVGAFGLPGILVSHPGWVHRGKATILYQASLKRHHLLPNVPTLPELAQSDEGRQVLHAAASTSEIGRSILTAPGVPPERIAALRSAFQAMLKDTDLLRACEKRQLMVDGAAGQEIDEIVRETLRLPQALAGKIGQMMQ